MPGSPITRRTIAPSRVIVGCKGSDARAVRCARVQRASAVGAGSHDAMHHCASQ